MPSRLSRRDLIDAIQSKCQGQRPTKGAISAVLDALPDVIGESLATGPVSLPGLATFKLMRLRPHRAYNLQKGETEMRPETIAIKAIASRTLQRLTKG